MTCCSVVKLMLFLFCIVLWIGGLLVLVLQGFGVLYFLQVLVIVVNALLMLCFGILVGWGCCFVCLFLGV